MIQQKLIHTGQFVFPKGTTAQQPSGTASATVPAATLGAMRFNSRQCKV